MLVDTYDLVVVGGGIHGVAVAADAAGRGLSVLLCEKNDLASGTSSASSKLIHGGLRYLNEYDFSLVRQALQERDTLFKMAPHLVRPLRFVVPYSPSLRPFWMIKLGLFIYDRLHAASYFEKAHGINLDHLDSNNPLKHTFKKGFAYSDAATDDARLVIATAQRAAQCGALILTRTACIDKQRQDKHWIISLQNTNTQKKFDVHAKAVVDASGPWIKDENIRLVKGSHIVVPKLYDHNQAYLLQHIDGRVVFVIPYEKSFTLIGTTDVDYDQSVDDVKISKSEIDYLCRIVNQYFKKILEPSEIVHTWSGVRALIKDNAVKASKTTREYQLTLTTDPHHASPLVSIVGGKLTTHRRLSEKVMEKLKPFFPHMGPSWTGTKPLPGGDLPVGSLKTFTQDLAREFSWLGLPLCERYAEQYGTDTYLLLENAKKSADLGICFGHDLYEKEVAYLVKHEWAQTAEDILWRRTKVGLHTNAKTATALSEWLSQEATRPMKQVSL